MRKKLGFFKVPGSLYSGKGIYDDSHFASLGALLFFFRSLYGGGGEARHLLTPFY